jgi:hypothetical protein
MGSSLFGGGTTKTNTTANNDSTTDYNLTKTSDPTAWQMPYLATGFNEADKIYRGAPTSPQQAYTSLDATKDINASSDFSRGSLPYSSGMMSSGQGMYQSAYPAAGGALSTALDRYSTDPTDSNITAAGKYADNPYTQGMIKSAQTPIERQLNEVSIPKLNVSANNSGNMDSSRAGVAEGLLRRDAGIDESNAAADILGKNWSSGLTTAENARTANNTGILNAAAGYGTLGNDATSLLATGNKMGLANAEVPITNAQTVQTDANALNKNSYTNDYNKALWPWLNLQDYWNIAGKPLGTNDTTGGSTTTNGLTTTNGTSTAPGPGVLKRRSWRCDRHRLAVCSWLKWCQRRWQHCLDV